MHAGIKLNHPEVVQMESKGIYLFLDYHKLMFQPYFLPEYVI